MTKIKSYKILKVAYTDAPFAVVPFGMDWIKLVFQIGLKTGGPMSVHT